MSDTPETDGEWNRLACQDHPEFERNLADFARKLERERDAAFAILKRVRSGYADARVDDGCECEECVFIRSLDAILNKQSL
jgi:hypothetical protein